MRRAVAQPSLVAEAVARQESARSVGAAAAETTAKHTHKNLWTLRRVDPARELFPGV